MCSLVANYESDEEQQSSAKPRPSAAKSAVDKISEFGWSIMQANMQRDMEISDDDTPKEEEIIPTKHLRRKKRIDFVTSTSNKFTPAPGPGIEEDPPVTKTEESTSPNHVQRTPLLERVTLPSLDYPATKVTAFRGFDDAADANVKLKTDECTAQISICIQNNFMEAEKLAPFLIKFQCMKDAWQACSLDSFYFIQKLDEMLTALNFSVPPKEPESSKQQTIFPMVGSTYEEVLTIHQDAPPPPPPPEEDYPAAPPPPPPPPEVDDVQLGDELSSFYSEMAGIEAEFGQKKEDGKNQAKETPEALKEEPAEPVEMVNKNRKGKISSSVGMKRKNVSSLMAKWKKVKQEWEGD